MVSQTLSSNQAILQEPLTSLPPRFSLWILIDFAFKID